MATTEQAVTYLRAFVTPAGAHESEAWADLICHAIADDMAAGMVPASVRSFTDLHDHVDANGYLADAGLDAPADDQAAMSTISAVCEVVSARLQQIGSL